MQLIPLQAVPSQTLSVTLGGQNCRLDVFERRGYAKRTTASRTVTNTEPDQPLLDDFGHPILDEFGEPVTDDEGSQGTATVTDEVAYAFPVIFVNLYVDDVLVIGGVQAHDGVGLVPDTYLNFSGYLAFVDLQGGDRPIHNGLGGRWVLVYFTDAELRS